MLRWDIQGCAYSWSGGECISQCQFRALFWISPTVSLVSQCVCLLQPACCRSQSCGLSGLPSLPFCTAVSYVASGEAWVGIVGSTLTLRHDLTGRVWWWPGWPVCCCWWGRGRECFYLSYFPWWFGQDLVRQGNRWSHCALRGGDILVSVSCLPNQSQGSWSPRWSKHVIWCDFLCGAPMSAAGLYRQGHWHLVGRNQPQRGISPRICPVWPIHIHILFLGHPVVCCGYRFVPLETLRLPACLLFCLCDRFCSLSWNGRVPQFRRLRGVGSARSLWQQQCLGHRSRSWPGTGLVCCTLICSSDWEGVSYLSYFWSPALGLEWVRTYQLVVQVRIVTTGRSAMCLHCDGLRSHLSRQIQMHWGECLAFHT